MDWMKVAQDVKKALLSIGAEAVFYSTGATNADPRGVTGEVEVGRAVCVITNKRRFMGVDLGTTSETMALAPFDAFDPPVATKMKVGTRVYSIKRVDEIAPGDTVLLKKYMLER